MPRPASRHHPVWLFDLDNTLHDASRHAFPTIDSRMTHFMAELLQLDAAAASHLRVHYWRRYGATILGLMRNHPHVDPQHFLHYCHPLAELLREIHPMPGLKRTLHQLRGRKILFTNGPLHYASAMLDALGIADQFDGIFAVESSRYCPKPQTHGYRRLLNRFRLQAHRCVLVEDTLANLKPAKRLGMRTIWLRRGNRGSSWADRTVRRLDALPRG
ncbi:putative hydrolase of the HAD superfamily [Andreprevotia lacus DSM 23236]|jgi:putative hydrolase of the HAD superfamily|uniref:Putative hydrolase of the HAD superfamily n=1 Tax=Andreprevotia lacus DSM 23236 TaxID=1121001 RepID=A0A1W1Y0N4_9NEIS|nr:pyrimidine 5'-nucleotidase [Andreprevotia lacus]SMC29723.1 putative hydrolase of the HAD superfamily [Andreprevotia lacus DSM 23236]